MTRPNPKARALPLLLLLAALLSLAPPSAISQDRTPAAAAAQAPAETAASRLARTYIDLAKSGNDRAFISFIKAHWPDYPNDAAFLLTRDRILRRLELRGVTSASPTEARLSMFDPDTRSFSTFLMALTPDNPDRIDFAGITAFNQVPVTDLTAQDVSTALGEKIFTFSVRDDVVTVYARSTDEEEQICCTVQGNLTRIAPTLWAGRWRLLQSQRALITLDRFPMTTAITWRGPTAPPEPRMKKVTAGKYTEVQIPSRALGETRKIDIYVPAGDWTKCPLPVLVAADGLQLWHQLVEALVEDGRMQPVLIVGLRSGQYGIVEDRSSLKTDIRAADYLPNWKEAPDRFLQHMDFATRELPDYILAHFPALPVGAHWAVAGQSNGAAFALQAGFLHPEIFGTAIPMSVNRPLANIKPTRTKARFLASAGLYEPSFLDATRESVKALTKAGYKAQMTEYAAGHASDQWQAAMAQALPLVFPPGKGCAGGK